MKINIATKNPIKVKAVQEVIKNYPMLTRAKVVKYKASSQVQEQPKSLRETVRGAKNRAKNAFHNCNYSIGLESGLIKIPDTKSGYMDTTVCVIYDGIQFHLGLSSCFEYPTKATRLVFEKGVDMNKALHLLKLTKNKKLGSAKGAIGLLTKNRLTRKEYTKQAIVTALIHLENPKLY